MEDKAGIVNEYFNDEKSHLYNDNIRQSIPGYMALHEMVYDFLFEALPDEAHLLIAGAGTGMELLLLGTRRPGWRFTAFDISPEMIALCRHAISKAGIDEQTVIIEGTVDDVPGNSRFDAATSLLVSHFVKGRENRLAYFSAVARLLKPGAVLLTADLTGDDTHVNHERFIGAWRRHNINNGRAPEEFDDDLAQSKEVVEFLPERQYCDVLNNAGFHELKEFYRAFHFSGWYCRRQL